MNIAMLLEMAASGLSDRVAVGGREDGLTYEELRTLAAVAGQRFAQSGADRVALLSRNHVALPITMFGAAWAGMTYAPLNHLLPRESIAPLLERLDPVVVVCDADARDQFDPNPVGGVIDIGDLVIPVGEGSAQPTAVQPEHEAVRLFTSGTTSEPKAAILRHRHLTSYVLATVEFASAGPDEAILLSVPSFHIAGAAGVLSSVYRGRRVVPLRQFSPEAWLETVSKERITHALVVPTMLARILEHVGPDDPRLSSLRMLSYGGAPMPRVVIEEALRVFPRATDFVNAYGLTETSSTIAILGPEDHRLAVESEDPKHRARLRSAGRPVPSIRLEIRDADDQQVLPGEVGEVLVSGEQVSGEYVGQGSTRNAQGWLRTGDRGWLDDDGYLYLEGRSDEVIIRGGENIAPAEIEDALLRHPEIAEAAVVGLADQQWGERVAALVTCRSAAALTEDDVTAWVRAELGSLKAPEVVVFAQAVPRTPMGKIIHRQVRTEIEVATGGPT